MKGRKNELTSQTSQCFAEERESRPNSSHTLATEYVFLRREVNRGTFPTRMRLLLLLFLGISQSINGNFIADFLN